MSNIVLVTGATGFIGSHLVDALVFEKRKVRCLVRRQSNDSHLKKIGAEIFYGDLTDFNSLKGIDREVETVYHLAAIARPMCIVDEMYFKVNVEGTKNLLEIFKDIPLKKSIYMSSISAVGPSLDREPVNENTWPHPIDVYGQSKLAAEKLVLDFIKKYNLPIVILRPPMVFGPRDSEMLKLFKIVKTKFFPICGSENGHFDFCYVGNLVKACLLAEEKGRVGEIYHVSNERAYTLREILGAISKAERIKLSPFCLPNSLMSFAGLLIESLGKILGFHPSFSRDTVRWMSTDFWVSDISKIKKELNYQPEYSLDEGIQETVRWYQENNFL